MSGEYRVRKIEPRGPYVRLSDGSNWEVRPGPDALGIRYWSIGDRVQVEKARSGASTHELTNRDTPGRDRPIRARRRRLR